MATPRVWLWANTLTFPRGGGHLWVYLNWALGLRSAGCEVTWLEAVDPDAPPNDTLRYLLQLRARLERYGLSNRIALCSQDERPLPPAVARASVPIDEASNADLLLNCSYLGSDATLRKFKRTALLDIDPGLLQVWISDGQVKLLPHDVYFTIGETVGRPDAVFPSCGIEWNYAPPAVSLEHWKVAPPPPKDAPFTTISNWQTSGEWFIWGEESFLNDKKTGFTPFIEMPQHTKQPLMLALCLRADDKLRLEPDEAEEKRRLQRLGWQIVHAHAAGSTPWDYQRFIHSSKGEFSCCKPSCVRLANAWISDRTICYLASGRPAVVQHTGASRFLPDAAGLFRFHDIPEAANYLEHVAADYPKQCRLARALAEEFFDAKRTAARVVERALK